MLAEAWRRSVAMVFRLTGINLVIIAALPTEILRLIHFAARLAALLCHLGESFFKVARHFFEFL